MDVERAIKLLGATTPQTPKTPLTPWVIVGIILGTVIYFTTRHAP
jgi:hypothetical protein